MQPEAFLSPRVNIAGSPRNSVINALNTHRNDLVAIASDISDGVFTEFVGNDSYTADVLVHVCEERGKLAALGAILRKRYTICPSADKIIAAFCK
jgi:hypothetical protein